MNSARFTYTLAAIVSLIALATTSAPASAGIFNVKPIRLYFTKDTSSVILTLQNQDTAPLRIQIAGVRWSNTRDGQTIFKPTDDLIVFPTLFTMNPLETRNIRIGFSGTPPRQTELTYRITIDELPSLESQLSKTGASGLSVRTRITVPVFFQPDTIVKSAQVADLSMRRGVAQALFANNGNFHVVVGDVDFTGRDASGAKVFSQDVKGWYVLAGESQLFDARIPRSRCNQVKQISITVHTDIGAFTRTAAAAPGDCA